MIVMRKRMAALSAAAVVTLLSVSAAQAASYAWYGDGSTVGGSGTWNTTGSNWYNGTAVGPWVNDGSAGALFNGTNAGTVTVDAGGVTVCAVNAGDG
jgi:hypothetical protein